MLLLLLKFSTAIKQELFPSPPFKKKLPCSGVDLHGGWTRAEKNIRKVTSIGSVEGNVTFLSRGCLGLLGNSGKKFVLFFSCGMIPPLRIRRHTVYSVPTKKDLAKTQTAEDSAQKKVQRKALWQQLKHPLKTKPGLMTAILWRKTKATKCQWSQWAKLKNG